MLRTHGAARFTPFASPWPIPFPNKLRHAFRFRRAVGRGFASDLRLRAVATLWWTRL